MTDYQSYLSLRNGFFSRFLLCLLITVALVYCHKLLPQHRMIIVPSPHSYPDIYTDLTEINHSRAAWEDKDQLAWTCDIPDDGKDHVCGFSITFGPLRPDGTDLSVFDTVNIDLDYTGTEKRLRFFIRNYEPGFSSLTNNDSEKFNNVVFPVEYLNAPFTFSFQEFVVAEWWFHKYSVPRKYNRVDFHHAISFGIDFDYPAAAGHHRLKLKQLEFVGLWISAAHWYLGIMCFWVLVIFVGGSLHVFRLKREYLGEQRRLQSLQAENNVLEEESNKYRELSAHDQLTGLLNRHGLLEIIDRHFSGQTRTTLGLIVIDIDFFKKINDTFGHDSGDRVLQVVATLIQNNIRASDYCARWGGEEFVVLLTNAHRDDVYHVAEKLRSAVSQAVFDGLQDLVVHISAGAGVATKAEPFDDLFRRVDKALYQAKQRGRNRIIYAD